MGVGSFVFVPDDLAYRLCLVFVLGVSVRSSSSAVVIGVRDYWLYMVLGLWKM